MRFAPKTRRGGLPGALLIVLACATAAAAGDELIDRVLGVAAGNLIMLSDVHAARDLGLVATGPAPDPLREILSRLIDRALVLAEVDRYAPPEPDSAAVDRAVETVRARFATADAWAAALNRVGISETHLRETLRGDLRIRAYLEQRFTVQQPGEEELGRFYRDHPELFLRSGQLALFADAREDVVRAAVVARRQALVDDWIAGLRRRADIVDLYSIKN